MNLSKNLTLKEVTKSQTAIRHGIDNTPDDEQLKNLVLVAREIFQPIREHFGVSIGISSGFRHPDVNTKIGGSTTSQHCKGQALDIDADIFGRVTNAEIFSYIRSNLTFDQLIWEFGNDNDPDWVHVSYSNVHNRKQILRAERTDKGTTYRLI